jgi:putative ABC transport system substrate-binding protein
MLTLGALVPAGAILAAPRPQRVGVFIHSRSGDADLVSSLKERLAAAGLVEGRDFVLHVESIELREASAAECARRLVAARPDVLYAITEPLVDALLRESRAIPIVFNSVTEPVRRGYVRSHAEPGGNLTGVTDRYVETGVKRLELLREIAPRARRVAFVHSDDDRVGIEEWAGVARRLRFEVVEVNAPRDGLSLGEALQAALRKGVDCLFPVGLLRDPSAPDRPATSTFVEFAARARLPAVYSSTVVVEQRAALASLEIDVPEMLRLGADMVARVLRGESPAKMPVQEPNRIAIALNLRAARAMGMTFPHSVRMRATQVFE